MCFPLTRCRVCPLTLPIPAGWKSLPLTLPSCWWCRRVCPLILPGGVATWGWAGVVGVVEDGEDCEGVGESLNMQQSLSDSAPEEGEEPSSLLPAPKGEL